MNVRFNLDDETTKLANKLRDSLGEHMLKFSALEIKEIIMSCLVALALEVGRLRWLAIATEEVEEEDFDRIFNEGVIQHYEKNKERYGTANN